VSTVEALVAFIAAASVLTITPGVDTAMVLRTAVVSGPRPAALAGLGISIGCLAWGGAVSLGLGAVLAASALAFSVLKWLGAAYLLWLGLRLVLSPRHDFDPSTGKVLPSDNLVALRQGFLTNVLNPKVGIFYLTFLPHFVPSGADMVSFSFLLALTHVALGALWFTLLIGATGTMRQFLRGSRIIVVLDRVTGGIFVAFAAKLALTR
jgi:threonine/homoserine/homoserine lactone efflux protein